MWLDVSFLLPLRLSPGMLVLESFWRGSTAGQGQLLLVSGLGLLGRSYKVICGLLSIVMGLGVLGRGYAANQIWLSLVSGLGPFGGHHDVNWDQLSLVPNLWPLHWNYVLGQDQPPPMQGLGAHNGSYNASWDWLLCVLSLGPLSKRSKHSQAGFCLFGVYELLGNSAEWAEARLLVWGSHWKKPGQGWQIEWDRSQGITRVGPMVLD